MADLNLEAERALFEAWAMPRGLVCDYIAGASGDKYILDETVVAWESWIAARRAAPPAAQLDADNLPPPDVCEHSAFSQPNAYSRAKVGQIVAPYAERIRHLERDLAEVRALAKQGMCHGLLADDYCSQIVSKIGPRVIGRENARQYMEESLWAFIECAGNYPGIKPDTRIWPHILAYVPTDSIGEDEEFRRLLQIDRSHQLDATAERLIAYIDGRTAGPVPDEAALLELARRAGFEVVHHVINPPRTVGNMTRNLLDFGKLVCGRTAGTARQAAFVEAAKLCDEMAEHYSDYKDTALLNGDVELSNAASGEPRACRFLAEKFRERAAAPSTQEGAK